MIKMSSQIENIISAYKTLSKIPSIAGGRLNKSGRKITATWSVRNLDKEKNIKYTNNYILDDNLKVIAESDFGTDVSNEILSAVSPKETYKAIIREEKGAKDAKKQYLEVWNKSTLAHSIDLTALDIHGDVYADSEFGSLDWSPDESAIVYVAEKKMPKTESYIKRMSEDKAKTNGSGENVPRKGEEYLYRQDWGEQLVGKHFSVVVVCRLSTETCSVLSGLPETWCPGQVRFLCDNIVVGAAWETHPRRLGLVYCTNRPAYIFSLTLDGQLSKLSSDGMAVRSPRVRTGGELVWLQRAASGPHHAAHQLVRGRTSTEVSTIIDIVQTEVMTANGVPFHGVYCHSLPKNCFSSDGTRLVFTSPQQNELRSYVVDTADGRLVDISNNKVAGSTSVLDVSSDVILAACSNMTTPGQLFVARLPAPGHEANIEWVQVSSHVELPQALRDATVEYLALEHSQSTDAVKSFSALYMSPGGAAGPLALVAWPHGGPHSNFVNSYSIEAALYTMFGFASLLINYRGSTGNGDATINFLLKRIGDADVKDCKLATDYVTERYPIDRSRLFLTGGSHGGFLVTHLSGQYPDTYKAVVARNPVIDVASMFSGTDIPDWCCVEAGYEWSELGGAREESLLGMRRCSPLAQAGRTRAPAALLLGAADRRVPPAQGLLYARALQAAGVPVRVYMYEDNHALSSLPAEADNLINGLNWFLEHL